MNDLLFAQELAAVLRSEAYADLNTLLRQGASAPLIFAAQSAALTDRPLLTLNGAYESYAHRRKGDLTFELRSRAGDSGDNEHSSRVTAVIRALLGEPSASPDTAASNRAAALAALGSALLTRGQVKLTMLGPALNFLIGDIDGEDLRTEFTFRCAWEFLPPV